MPKGLAELQSSFDKISQITEQNGIKGLDEISLEDLERVGRLESFDGVQSACCL